MTDVEQLTSLLQVIRATSRPLDSDSDKGALENQWDEVQLLLAKMGGTSTGSAAIADKVKQLLDSDYPGAVLTDTMEVANTVFFSTPHSSYIRIEIKD